MIPDMSMPPVLPYKGTSGYAGTDTSRERAEVEASGGTTGARQAKALRLLALGASRGQTWKELALTAGWHHGQASAALSNLHKAGRIARLTERRDRCKVYVLLGNVAGREVEQFAPNKRAMDWADTLRAWGEADTEEPLDFKGQRVPIRVARLLDAAFGPEF